MQLDYSKQSEEELYKLLSYADMRIRQKSQLELAKREKKGWEIFKRAVEQQDNQLARVHGIWGIGQLARKDLTFAAPLLDLFKDNDPEIVAQAAKIAGDVNYKEAGSYLIPLLSHEYPRAVFFAAQALGRTGFQDAVAPILSMLERNNDKDVYLRHAGVLALTRIGQEGPVAALVDNPSRALRTAAVLVLRRMKSEKVALFLQDKDEYIVAEAARAINDDLSIEKALPALAATLSEKRFLSEPLLRRGINACLRVGGEKEMDILISFANRKDLPAPIRAEALATLGGWANPSVLDRVDGRFRGKIDRDPALVTAKVRSLANQILQSKDAEILVAGAQMLSALNISDYNEALVKLMQQHNEPSVRSAMLTALHDLKYDDIEPVIKRGMNDKDVSVRTAAVGLLNELDITKENLPGIVDPIFKKGSIQEQQQLLKVLGEMPVEKSEPVLEGLIGQLSAKKLSPAITLDLIEAVDLTHSEKLIAMLTPLRPTGSSTEGFMEALYGGDSRRGRRYFMTNSTAQCARCHAIRGEGGIVGPDLTHIGDNLSREELLRALIEPSARLSPGYGSVKLTLKDGQVISGILTEETESELILKTSDAEPLKVALSRISNRENMISGMPPMGTLMSRREIRDMVEFLANLKKED